jgi:hypothetical protein
MKPEHRLMLRKVGKGSMFKEPVMQDRRHRMPEDLKPKPEVDPRPYMPTVERDRRPVNFFRGEGVKRKPLKFKL